MMFCDVTRPHLTIPRLWYPLAIVWLLSSFIGDAASGTRDMVRPVKFLCSDAGSIEVVGNAILAAHRNEEDQDAAARLAARPFIEAGTCVLLPRPAEVQLRRVLKWLSAEMAIWEVENQEGRIRYALSLPVMDQLAGAMPPRVG